MELILKNNRFLLQWFLFFSRCHSFFKKTVWVIIELHWGITPQYKTKKKLHQTLDNKQGFPQMSNKKLTKKAGSCGLPCLNVIKTKTTIHPKNVWQISIHSLIHSSIHSSIYVAGIKSATNLYKINKKLLSFCKKTHTQ